MTTILLDLVVVSVFFAFTVQAPEPQLKDADGLFAQRDAIESLRQAVALTERVVAAGSGNYEALWRLSKYRYYLADREPDKERRAEGYQSGADLAKKAIAANPNRVEGHFWLAANSGELADLKGALDSLGLLRTIRKGFESALEIDPTYESGAIHLALGEMDLKLPRLLGGNDRRGIERLEAGMKVGPNNAELKVALADVYTKRNRQDDARKLLQSVINDNDPLRSPNEISDLRDKARKKLEEIKY